MSRLLVYSAEEIESQQEIGFVFAEPGFIVELLGSDGSSRTKNYCLVQDKDEKSRTIRTIPLTQENVLTLLAGKVPTTLRISTADIVKVFATAITDNMCRDRPQPENPRAGSLPIHCYECRKRLWRGKESSGLDKRPNFVVGPDGFCRHVDCNVPGKRVDT